MFEFIGMAVVAWFVFIVVRGFLRGNSTARSREFGLETRRVAVKEMGVPESYYNYIVTNLMTEMKSAAMEGREHVAEFKNVSWPRVLGFTISGQFNHDCLQWQLGNPKAQVVFDRTGVTTDQIVQELERGDWLTYVKKIA